MTSRPPRTIPTGRTLALALGLSAAVFGLTLVRQRPPAPKPPDTPPGEFSAGRAHRVLEALVGDGRPHPQGSRANADVRERVIAELSRLGFEPSVQERFTCGRYGTCGTVKNVLARLPGTAGIKAVLLCAHYDSVGAGPGASDDGMGVAALLEVARTLKMSPPLRNPVVFLIDDGEESGLLGAEAFAADDPRAGQIGAVVNVDDRGSSGASLLFETSENNRWLVRLAAAALPRPNTSSVFSTVYKRMPNDTDLTVFREKGMAGVNFACVGDVAHYHTPLDNVANASMATLQQHGDNALTMTRALGNANLEKPPTGNAVFFDVFGLTILWWPEEWTPELAALAVLLLLMAVGLTIRRGDLSWRCSAWGLAGGLAILVVPGALAYAAKRALAGAGAFPTNWIAYPLPSLAGFWLLAF
ncbi:MAG TPA: M28 family peptidase, partial [Thermoanaerobaculia bacterium]|nr:M28 family peptidase [Thermoanaerobaculia bacterium]